MISKCVIVIPSRLNSVRLPQKSLLPIAGEPMVMRVWQRAVAANMGQVIIATCGNEIGDVMKAYGAEVVITDPDLPSGTDRIWAALQEIKLNDVDVVVNLQGDLPNIPPIYLNEVLKPLQNPMIDISTIAAPITNPSEINNDNVVKIAMSAPVNNISNALYFSRQAIPYGADTYFHHIGVYAYRYQALQKFVELSSSYLEKCERLEQLRALEAGMRLGVAVVDKPPQSVDTQADLDLVRRMWNHDEER